MVKFARLYSLLGLLSCVSVFVPQVAIRPLRAETPTGTYSRSVTLYPSRLPTQSTHDTMVIVLEGLSLTIGEGVFQAEGYICFNGDVNNAAIQLPHVITTASGPHGLGYTGATFGPMPESGYSYNVGILYGNGEACTENRYRENTNRTEPFSLATHDDGAYLNFAVASAYEGGISTRCEYVTFTYACFAA
jgi:hypothetical protein